MGLLDDAIREHLDLKRRRGGDPAEIEKAEREALGPVRRDGSAVALSNPAVAEVADPVASDEFVFDSEAFEDEFSTTVAPADRDEIGELPEGIAPPVHADDDFDAPATRPAKDELDPPTGQALAAMPPEPAHKPKRRHLFHFRSHDNEPEDDFVESSPLPPELPEDDPFADDFHELTPESLAPTPPPAVDDRLADEPAPGAAVSRPQPISQDEDPQPPRQSAPPSLRLTPDAELGHTVEYDVEKAFQEEDQAGEDLLEETPEFLADTPDHDRLWFEQKPPPDFDFDQ